MIKKIFKYGGIAILCLIVVTLSAALLYRKYLQNKVSEARAITSVNGMDSLEAVRIGGIEQWIEVRGQNVNNPILLFLHGGPGVAFLAMGSTFQDPLGEIFHGGGMGPTRSGKNLRIERQGTSAANDEPGANGAGHGGSGELSANSIQTRKNICGGAFLGKHAGPVAGA